MKSARMPVIALLGIFVLIFDVSGQIRSQMYEDLMVRGKVTDALTKEPINATLIFESVPDASDVYIIDAGNEGDGVYEVSIRSREKFIVEISSDNYKPEIDTVVIEDDLSSLDFQLLSVKPGQLLRLHNIYFAQGDFQILEQSRQEISEIVLLLNQYPDMIIRLEGHTDRLGGRSANLTLSENRVQEIKKYLINSGIHHKRVKTAAFGGSKPISTEGTEESRRLNRRVEVRILSI
jgi:outer membrane protein OmpA-like peptidoglycan-associated protein